MSSTEDAMKLAVRQSGFMHTLRYFFDPPNEGLIKSRGDWRVYYPPCQYDNKGGFSIRMSYGGAADYAEMFGGFVLRNRDAEHLMKGASNEA